MNRQKFLGSQRIRRKYRIRKRLHGTPDRPRMSVNRSHANISCQLIDDSTHKTLLSVNSQDKDLRESLGYSGNAKAAQAIGKIVAERALAAGIKQVRFDRGSSRYHGRVAALADAAREAGLTL